LWTKQQLLSLTIFRTIKQNLDFVKFLFTIVTEKNTSDTSQEAPLGKMYTPKKQSTTNTNKLKVNHEMDRHASKMLVEGDN